MNWLPCIRHGSDRWWLPLSRQAADVLAAALVAGPGNPRRLAALQDQMRVDPPLLIFAALATGGDDFSRPRPPLTIAELAHSLDRQLASLLVGGDAALGVPAEPRCEGCTAEEASLLTRTDQLLKRFVQLPRSQWLVAAGEWLELTGPAVPAAWRDAWPTITSDPVEPPGQQIVDISYEQSQLDLSALARTIRRGQSLENAYRDSLREAKRAALKQFAYGLSHEINNPLANISTRAQTLLRDEQDPSRGKSLQRIVDQAMRAHEMVADLMFYAHPPAPQKNSVDLHGVLRSVAKQSLEIVQERCIDLIISQPAVSLTLVADRGMMIEAVRALVRNAIEAVGCDGKVQLACQRQLSSDSSHSSPAGSGSIAVITVCDSGPGLSDAAREHAFDPYFSGREAGRGLGVGLCRVQRIAQLHGGDVSLHSGPAGCTARLWIPLGS